MSEASKRALSGTSRTAISNTPSYALSRKRSLRREAEHQKNVQGHRAALELEVVSDPEDALHRIKDRQLAHTLGCEFVRQYPGHGWQVEVDIRNGIANVFNMHISGRIGWRLKLGELREATFSRDVMRIGGEMLARSGLSRGKFNEEAVMMVQRDFSGHAKVDLS